MTVNTYVNIMTMIFGFGLPFQIYSNIKMIKGKADEKFYGMLYNLLFLATQIVFIIFQISN